MKAIARRTRCDKSYEKDHEVKGTAHSLDRLNISGFTHIHTTSAFVGCQESNCFVPTDQTFYWLSYVVVQTQLDRIPILFISCFIQIYTFSLIKILLIKYLNINLSIYSYSNKMFFQNTFKHF